MQKKTITTLLLWKISERYLSSLISFIASVVMARLILPELFGTIAVILVITDVLCVPVKAGLDSALIQKQDAEKEDYSSAFVFSSLASVAVLLVYLTAAPHAVEYFNADVSDMIVSFFGLKILITGISNTLFAEVQHNMQFKKLFLSSLLGTVISSGIGIAFAKKGYGIWALTLQNISNQLLSFVFLAAAVSWKPRASFSLDKIRTLLSYGWKIMVSSLIASAYSGIYQLIIGKKISVTELAYYNKGEMFPDYTVINFNSAVDSVLFPSVSSVQDDAGKVSEIMSKSIKMCSFIVFPLMALMFGCSETMIKLLLGEAWEGSIFYVRLFSFVFALYPIYTVNLNTIKAIGRSDIFLRLEIEKIAIGLALLGLSVPFGIKGISISIVIQAVIGLFINSRPNKVLVGYGFIEQIEDISLNVISSVSVLPITFLVSQLNISKIIMLLLQVISGTAVYLAVNILMHNDCLKIIASQLKRLRHRSVQQSITGRKN